MTEAVRIQPQLIAFARELKPVLASIREGKACLPGTPCNYPSSTWPDITQRRLESYSERIDALLDILRSLDTTVASQPKSSDAEVTLAVMPLKEWVDGMVDAMLDLTRLHAGTNDRIRNLLVGIYVHTLEEVAEWLLGIIDTLTNPEDALQQRGLTADRPAVLDINLRLTPAPQIDVLSRLQDEKVMKSAKWHGLGLGALVAWLFWG